MSKHYDRNELEDEPKWVNNTFQPQKDRAAMCCALFNSIVWGALYGAFVWSQDDNCQQGELYHFSKIAFFLFIACAVIETIVLLTLILSPKSQKSKVELKVISCLLVLSDCVMGLFIYIRGIVVIKQDQAIVGCQSIYYLILIYVIIMSSLISIFTVVICVSCCCFLYDRMKD